MELTLDARASSLSPIDGLNLIQNDEIISDYVLDTDVVIDGPREKISVIPTCDHIPLCEDIRPVLMLGTRLFMDEEASLHLCCPLSPPRFEHYQFVTVVRRLNREVVAIGDLKILWSLIGAMDGFHDIRQILELHPDEKSEVLYLIIILSTAGLIDISGRPIARALHTYTKKGVLPGGGLRIRDQLLQVTDNQYLSFPQKERISLRPITLNKTDGLYSIIKKRRSYRDFTGDSIHRSELETILITSCGITGSMIWANREVKLRAYPSSGGLYAVEIYPILLNVEELEQAIYHYKAVENELELVKRIDLEALVGCALPSEKIMLRGISAMFCLTGNFVRHEQKYGEGGYRMMVAEAGHISENIILSCTALELDARPFGGVFDDMLNGLLELDEAREQFLLSVIVGHAARQK